MGPRTLFEASNDSKSKSPRIIRKSVNLILDIFKKILIFQKILKLKMRI